jgi:hypothetical protein
MPFDQALVDMHVLGQDRSGAALGQVRLPGKGDPDPAHFDRDAAGASSATPPMLTR